MMVTGFLGTVHAASAVGGPYCAMTYVAEFDFRYSTRKLSDSMRMREVLLGVGGRRLTYRPLTGQDY